MFLLCLMQQVLYKMRQRLLQGSIWVAQKKLRYSAGGSTGAIITIRSRSCSERSFGNQPSYNHVACFTICNRQRCLRRDVIAVSLPEHRAPLLYLHVLFVCSRSFDVCRFSSLLTPKLFGHFADQVCSRAPQITRRVKNSGFDSDDNG